MSSRFWIRLAEIGVVIALSAAILFAWRADRRDRAQLTSELLAAKQVIAAADAREHDRDSGLAQTLAAIASEKKSVIDSRQILQRLPKEIGLPVPITLETPARPASAGANQKEVPNTIGGESKTLSVKSSASASTDPQSSPKPQAIIPAEDLKPLYDFAMDCKACQARLAAAEGDLADEKLKESALLKERDQALRAARGGTALRRIARATKWFVLGAAAGAIAAKATH